VAAAAASSLDSFRADFGVHGGEFQWLLEWRNAS
jgi:hypothetical protein